MRKCYGCGRCFDHRSNTVCPFCGAVPQTLQALQAENRRLCAQVKQLQEHNTAEVERRRKAEGERDLAHQVADIYARRGDLEAQLVSRLVEPHGRKALALVLEELRKAKVKHPRFATGPEQAFVVLSAEHGELATAILAGDIHGEHGVIREAAWVAAVSLRIIEMCMTTQGEVQHVQV